MEKAIRYCKVCGAPYEYCHTSRPTTIFRWQDVACSKEHGAIYFAEIAKSRGEKVDEKVAAMLVDANKNVQGELSDTEQDAPAARKPRTKKKIVTEDTATV